MIDFGEMYFWTAGSTWDGGQFSFFRYISDLLSTPIKHFREFSNDRSRPHFYKISIIRLARNQKEVGDRYEINQMRLVWNRNPLPPIPSITITMVPLSTVSNTFWYCTWGFRVPSFRGKTTRRFSPQRICASPTFISFLGRDELVYRLWTVLR